jgi:hypothetical protein
MRVPVNRVIPKGSVGRIHEIFEESECTTTKMEGDIPDLNLWFGEIDPIDNLAITLAPEEATHVSIDIDGVLSFWGAGYQCGNDIHWPQCPDELKGHTFPLPGRGEE